MLDKAIKKHGDLEGPLGTWLSTAQHAAWTCLDDIRKSWRNTDAVEGSTVFNIKGNNYRLICQINYRSQSLFIEKVLTHAEYDKEDLKK